MFMLIVLLARIIVMPSFASCTVLLMVMCIYAMASRRRACVGLDTVRLRVSRARAREVRCAVSCARCASGRRERARAR